MAKKSSKEKPAAKKAEKSKRKILKSLDAVFDTSVEELMEETDQQAWERGEAIECAEDETE